MNTFSPQRVIEIGWTDGKLLRQFQEQGVPEVRGVCDESLEVFNAPFTVDRHNFKERYRVTEKYDLCICLGLIETCPAEFAENIIQSCVGASDTIVFGCTPPGERSLSYANVRPLTHWVKEFYKRGYVFHDSIRPHLEPLVYSPYEICCLGSTHLLNIYVLSREIAIGPGKEGSASFLMDILIEKERRIEDLCIQNFYQGIALREYFHNYSQLIEQCQHYESYKAFASRHEERCRQVKLNLDSRAIRHEGGFCYIYIFKTIAARIFASTRHYGDLILSEDGKALGSGRELHEDIRTKGSGRYSFWFGQIFFSASDNSDPRSNGCIYSVEVPAYIGFLENLPDLKIKELKL